MSTNKIKLKRISDNGSTDRAQEIAKGLVKIPQLYIYPT